MERSLMLCSLIIFQFVLFTTCFFNFCKTCMFCRNSMDVSAFCVDLLAFVLMVFVYGMFGKASLTPTVNRKILVSFFFFPHSLWPYFRITTDKCPGLKATSLCVVLEFKKVLDSNLSLSQPHRVMPLSLAELYGKRFKKGSKSIRSVTLRTEML